ncbi:MAG: hypothetical protein BVN35_01715 [Proteobacteria bacterium ST_bin11]|nr:MAG: hypothetical protein BVN35_01715 [Proteobacteria bacterium ST_bin11]
MDKFDVIIVGAGASGLMCAIEAAKRGRRVKIVEHANKPGKKILMSGGGRCNFTNYSIAPENYISNNPHFCKSALSRFTQWDFLGFVQGHQIPFHERLHGQLFCDNSAKDILDALLTECGQAGVTLELNCRVERLEKPSDGDFLLHTSSGLVSAAALVIASGGLSIPKMGATPFGYKVAEQFGINVWPTRAGLVPLTLQPDDSQRFTPLTGIAVPCRVSNQQQSFKENILFTHRGLSGPAILQISSYWYPGEALQVDLLPDLDLLQELKEMRRQGSKLKIQNLLAEYLPKRLLQALLDERQLDITVANCADKDLNAIAASLHNWTIKPNATEGYRTAEVTVGGVDCDAISSKTMQSLQVPGLYFVGEVLDVTGWLGGYNFQWAWASGWCAGQYA